MLQDGIGDSMIQRKQKVQKTKNGLFSNKLEIKLRNVLKSLLKIISKNPRDKMPSDFLLLNIACLSIYFRTKMMAMLFLFDEIDRKSTRLNSSHVSISYAVFCF